MMLYFNTMYVCFCGALVVNKLFQLHVDVFFMSQYHLGDLKHLSAIDNQPDPEKPVQL